MAAMVIVGAGHAAGQAAASLRQEGFDGEIVIIGDEPHIPYQRPPLSKQYLAGEQGIERVYLRPAKFYEDKNVTVRTGERVDRIDTKAGTVTTDKGETIPYDKLLLATGGRPRRLTIPGHDLRGIHYLRGIDDVDGIRQEMAPKRKLVIVGGGYIGLEVAAVAVEAGLEVHVLEMEQRILQRVTTERMSAYYRQLHESRGVHIHTGAAVTAFTGSGHVEGVLCGDQEFPADIVIIGIGIIPNTEVAQAAGIDCDNGILVDDHCRTSATDVFAAGDCTNHPNALLNRRLRLESVPNAMEQARVAAANMCGGDKTYASIPWFWSDQYELKLQMVGFSADGDNEVVRGEMADDKFAVFYLDGTTLVAADAVNSPKEFMICKQLIGKAVDAARLADPDTDLKALLDR
ncbi:MAG: FAD-dependent oxidoreductase [Gammaproteobacteria bacterium]|nr:FAD-dependent oxidoreductase [Gammaproteobacteria bacterium]